MPVYVVKTMSRKRDASTPLSGFFLKLKIKKIAANIDEILNAKKIWINFCRKKVTKTK